MKFHGQEVRVQRAHSARQSRASQRHFSADSLQLDICSGLRFWDLRAKAGRSMPPRPGSAGTGHAAADRTQAVSLLSCLAAGAAGGPSHANGAGTGGLFSSRSVGPDFNKVLAAADTAGTAASQGGHHISGSGVPARRPSFQQQPPQQTHHLSTGGTRDAASSLSGQQEGAVDQQGANTMDRTHSGSSVHRLPSWSCKAPPPRPLEIPAPSGDPGPASAGYRMSSQGGFTTPSPSSTSCLSTPASAQGLIPGLLSAGGSSSGPAPRPSPLQHTGKRPLLNLQAAGLVSNGTTSQSQTGAIVSPDSPFPSKASALQPSPHRGSIDLGSMSHASRAHGIWVDSSSSGAPPLTPGGSLAAGGGPASCAGTHNVHLPAGGGKARRASVDLAAVSVPALACVPASLCLYARHACHRSSRRAPFGLPYVH